EIERRDGTDETDEVKGRNGTDETDEAKGRNGRDKTDGMNKVFYLCLIRPLPLVGVNKNFSHLSHRSHPSHVSHSISGDG
ncbi:MAG TPA: hypothetical protein PLA12_03865, partial [Candidatus Hydrogenedens sp.]|nr:hypothetical protein [Candidatus Hydrogenedens sp.]